MLGVLTGKVYLSCVRLRSSVIHGGETFSTEVSMLRRLCGCKLKDRKRNAEIRELLGLEPVSLIVKEM